MANVTANLNIQYTYHIHTGSSGTTADGCYINPVYHTHIDNCYVVCGGKNVYVAGGGSYVTSVKCNKCGTQGVRSPDYNPNNNWDYCSEQILTCSKNATTIDTYSLGCGKTEDTIESAIIIF